MKMILKCLGRTLVAPALLIAGLVTIVGSGGGGGGGEATPVPNPSPPNTSPTITTQPASASVTVPATATFTVVAAGTPSPTYQWQVSIDNGVTFSDITGATVNSYTTPPTVITDSGKRYRVVVSNAAGSATSDAATLTVGASGGPPVTVPTTCVPADVLPAGTVIESTLATTFNGVPGNPISATLRVVGASTFQGQPAFETSIPIISLLPGTIRAFTNYDPTSRELTVLGAITHLATADGSTVQDTTSIVRQPARYPLYTLSVGQSATETVTADSTTVTTTNGVPGAPMLQTETTTTVYTYLGLETLTTPAGTFGTCKFTTQANGGVVSTTWQMVGYGVAVKFLSGGTVETLTSVSVNGTPLTQFP
jgi:hypothetical protein